MKSSYYVNHTHKTCICFSLTPGDTFKLDIGPERKTNHYANLLSERTGHNAFTTHTSILSPFYTDTKLTFYLHFYIFDNKFGTGLLKMAINQMGTVCFACNHLWPVFNPSLQHTYEASL